MKKSLLLSHPVTSPRGLPQSPLFSNLHDQNHKPPLPSALLYFLKISFPQMTCASALGWMPQSVYSTGILIVPPKELGRREDAEYSYLMVSIPVAVNGGFH